MQGCDRTSVHRPGRLFMQGGFGVGKEAPQDQYVTGSCTAPGGGW